MSEIRTISNFSDEYDFLSNFYERPFFWYGHTYKSVEHSYQAAKACGIMDWTTVFHAPTPGLAKRAGRKIRVRPDWELAKRDLMLDMLWHKFKPSDLAERLVATGDAALLEGNVWHDNVWGNCWCPKCKDTPGENALGKALMVVRERLRILV